MSNFSEPSERAEQKVWDSIIIGAGLAGCSAAIQLARHGHSVLLLERSANSPMKMCGEFLSPEAAGYLDSLCVLDKIIALGARTIDRFHIVGQTGIEISGSLPNPGLSISRQKLDAALMRRAVREGVVCRTGVAVDAVSGSFGKTFTVTADGREFKTRSVIGAYGKRSRLDKALDREHTSSPLVAFKAHFKARFNSDIPDGTIEVFGFRGGYVGVEPIENGLVNFCLIAHRSALENAGGRAEMLIESIAIQNKALARRLKGLERVSPFLGCSNIAIKAKSCFDNDVCMVGDSAGMIAPLCGDGMAMALASAKLAARDVDKFLRGRIGSNELIQHYTKSWKREFTLRLAVGNALQAISMSEILSASSLKICAKLPQLTNFVIGATRGSVKRSFKHRLIPLHQI